MTIYSELEHLPREGKAILYITLTLLVYSSHLVIEDSHIIWNDI